MKLFEPDVPLEQIQREHSAASQVESPHLLHACQLIHWRGRRHGILFDAVEGDGVTLNGTASTDPEAWSIVDGKLYLNFSVSVRAQWSEDIPGNITKGDSNWPGLRADLV